MFVTRIGERSKYIITGDLEQSDLKKRQSGLEDAIKRFAGVHGVGLASFKDRHIVRHSLVRRLLNRYKDNFQIIDEVSAEDTISMWVHDEMNVETPTDGSMDNINYQLINK
jgi:phosphate starvation-inducible protein PhoH